MYEYILNLVVCSNLGSFIKEDILRNNLIKKGEKDSYYKEIEEILKSKKRSFIIEKELTKFLKEH